MKNRIALGFVLIALSIAGTKGQPNSASFQACRTELGINDPSKFTCMLGCVGKKEGWINNDGTLNVNKKVDAVTQMGMPAEDIPKLRAAAEICKNEGQGQTDPCQLGDKIFNCMMKNGAPRPPMPPPPFN